MSAPPVKLEPHAVKDAMVRREADWLKTLGGTVSSREIEARVNRGLERMYARRREAVPAHLRPASSTMSERRQKRRAEREAASGNRIFTRPVLHQQTPRGPACRGCGICLDCRRAARLRLIMQKGREQDQACTTLAWDFYCLVNAFQAGTPYKDPSNKLYPFDQMRRGDRKRAFDTAMDAICDRSAAAMGAWR